MKTISDINKIIDYTDNSVEEYSNCILNHLRTVYNDFSIHAMSDYANVLYGQKKMLCEVILFLENNK